ncbi:hypothetical protein, partial [Slackia piriformis]|uniref:hypothetical protein n=1 Tax=Slackia piriformis TaxID=626934 RepID=UPI0026DD4187
ATCHAARCATCAAWHAMRAREAPKARSEPVDRALNLARPAGVERQPAMNGCLRIIMHDDNCTQKENATKGSRFQNEA